MASFKAGLGFRVRVSGYVYVYMYMQIYVYITVWGGPDPSHDEASLCILYGPEVHAHPGKKRAFPQW